MMQNVYAKQSYITRYSEAVAGCLASRGISINETWDAISRELCPRVMPELLLSVAHYLKFGRHVEWSELKALIRKLDSEA